MKPRLIIRTGITASAIAHLSVLMLMLFFTEVHPFGSVTAEPITVDIVSSAEVTPTPKKDEPLPEPKPQPSDAFDLPSKSAPSNSAGACRLADGSNAAAKAGGALDTASWRATAGEPSAAAVNGVSDACLHSSGA